MTELPGEASARRVAEIVVARAREQGRDVLAELDLLEDIGSHGRMTPAMASAIRAAATANDPSWGTSRPADVDGKARS